MYLQFTKKVMFGFGLKEMVRGITKMEIVHIRSNGQQF